MLLLASASHPQPLTPSESPKITPPPIVIPAKPVEIVDLNATSTRMLFARNLIDKYAAKYNVDPEIMYQVVKCETAGTFDPSIQSRYVFANGVRERSFGLAQIYTVAHPHIPISSMKDPDFAIEFMAKHMSAGRYSMWTCYTWLKNRGAI